MRLSKYLLGAFIAAALVSCGWSPYGRSGFEFPPSAFYPPPPPGETLPQRAEELLSSGKELTLDEVLAVTDVLNPLLNAARKEIDLRGAEAWDAGLYPNPRFVFEVEEYRTSGGSFNDAKRTGGISQELPLSGRLSAARRLKELEREAAIERVRLLRRHTLTRAKLAFLEVLGAQRRVELLRKSEEIARRFHSIAEEKFKNRAAPEIELLKAAIQKAVLESDLKLAERDAATARKALAALMGNIDLPFQGVSGELAEEYETVSLEALRGQVLSEHPGLAAAAKDLEAAGQAIDLARREGWPDVELTVRGGRGEAGDTVIEAGLSIPIPLFNRNQAKIAAAEAAREQARYALDSRRQEVLLDLSRAFANYLSAQERARSYKEEILPKAAKAVEQSEQGFRAGEFDFLTVLDSQRTAVEAQLAGLAAQLDLEAAAAALEELIGKRLRVLK